MLIQMTLSLSPTSACLQNSVELRQAHWCFGSPISLRPTAAHPAHHYHSISMFFTQYITPAPGQDPAHAACWPS